VPGWWMAAFAVQWVLLIALSVVVVALARQLGVLHLRLGPLGALEIDDEGPPLGQTPPPFRARAADGSAVDLGGPGSGRLVVFESPTCPVCERLRPSVPAAGAAAGLVPQVVSDQEAERVWAVPGVPFVVILDPFGVVRAKGTVNDLEQLEGLLDTAARRMTFELQEARAG
jgi:hypothetical protein